ncbi:MAG: hypothetical protein EOO03_16510, partial [Chitinophagaceae bacterium]
MRPVFLLAFLGFAAMLWAGPALGQGCTDGLQLQPGTQMEYKTYKKKKNKPEYTARHHVTNIIELEDRTQANLKCAFYNADGIV